MFLNPILRGFDPIFRGFVPILRWFVPILRWFVSILRVFVPNVTLGGFVTVCSLIGCVPKSYS